MDLALADYNKAIEIIRINNILRSPDVIHLLPNDMQDLDNVPMITYRLTNTVRNKIFNYKQTVKELFGLEAAADIYPRCKKCIETGTAITYEENLILQGREMCFLTTLNPIKDIQGQVYRLIGTTLNITERKQAEEKLRTSQHFIQTITDSSPNVLYIYDFEKQKTIYVNREAVSFLGYFKENILASIDQLMLEITHPEDLEVILSQQQKILAAGDGDILEFEYLIFVILIFGFYISVIRYCGV